MKCKVLHLCNGEGQGSKLFIAQQVWCVLLFQKRYTLNFKQATVAATSIIFS